MSAPKTAVSPSWTWGSSAAVEVTNATAPGPPPTNARVVTSQLAQISLPEPAVCSIYFQASVESNFIDDVVTVLTLNLAEGIGRVTVPRQISFLAQPAPGAPLEHTIPFVPVHALNVDIQVNVRLNNPAGSLVRVQTYFVLSPLTRIPQQIQKLQFGMALPGEADDLDDELRGELEAEGPSVAAMMGQDRQQVDGSSPEEDDDADDADDADPMVERSPAWLMTLIDQLTRKLGRAPTRPELVKVVRRVRQRVARRASR
jgi:hypothetical protein